MILFGSEPAAPERPSWAVTEVPKKLFTIPSTTYSQFFSHLILLLFAPGYFFSQKG
jgi:hypothetical protein